MTVMTMITVIDLPLTEATEMGCESEKSLSSFILGFHLTHWGISFWEQPKRHEAGSE